MPVGNLYTSRPYSSFRAPRGSCVINFGQNTNTNNNSSGINNSNNMKNNNNCLSNGNSVQKNKIQNNGMNPLSTSSSSNAICCNKNNNNNSNHNNQFQRQQPLRSSFYSTCYAHNNHHNNNHNHTNTNTQNNGVIDKHRCLGVETTTVKPLTPKLVRRIESTCTHQKQRAPPPPPPPSSLATTTSSATQSPQTSSNITASKQYLRARNQQLQSPTVSSTTARNSTNFERFHNTNLSFRQKINNARKSPAANNNNQTDTQESNEKQRATISVRNAALSGSKRAYNNVKVSKENQPTTNTTTNNVRSLKNYPAPLPPNVNRKKYREELKPNSNVASPCLNRRTDNTINKPQINKTPNMTDKLKNGGSGSNSSSASQGSPKTKKAFSTKFPQGLPFEDEFYQRYRSYSQSSSNYSFYSPNSPNGVKEYEELNRQNGLDNVNVDDEDDEFQRKPAHDESLYVDFSKVMHRQDNQTKITTTTNTTTTTTTTTMWQANGGIKQLPPNLPPRTNKYKNESSLNSAYMGEPRVARCKAPQTINEYLYTNCGRNGDNRNYNGHQYHRRSSIMENPEEDEEERFYSQVSPEPPPENDIYTAISSWAPKCSHPTKVIIGNGNSKDANNNDAHLCIELDYNEGAGSK